MDFDRTLWPSYNVTPSLYLKSLFHCSMYVCMILVLILQVKRFDVFIIFVYSLLASCFCFEDTSHCIFVGIKY